MERIVSNLYDTLSTFVGSKEEIYTRQRWFHIRDLITKNCHKNEMTIKSSGSRAEGLALPGSDLDLMFIKNDIIVQPQEDGEIGNSDLIFDTTNVKPGFVKLKVEQRQIDNDKFGDFVTAFTPIGRDIYLSSLLFRDVVVKTITRNSSVFKSAEAHGPCATSSVRGVEMDNMICLKCKVWPFQANEWIHRRRINNWPSEDLVEDIVSKGCLLVPIGNPLSQQSYMEWRISFSLAEKQIIHSMNHTQMLCYALLKLYLKHVIDSKEECKGLLCSYFLKTALFYCIEEDSIVWEKHNLLNCFWTCFKRIFVWVRQGYCPSYFIKTNNMFESKIFGKSKEQLTEHLFSLYQSGVETLLQIPVLSTLLQDRYYPGLLNEYVLMDNLKNVESECDIMLFFIHLLDFEIKDTMTGIEFTQRFVVLPEICLVDKIRLRMHFYQCHVYLTQHLYQRIVTTDISNSLKYSQFANLSRHIQQNCTNHDICTGLLQYATLKYLTRKYKQAVPILQEVLTKFKYFVLYYGRLDMYKNQTMYREQMCGKGYSIEHKLKFSVARSYECLLSCGFYPAEIENEVKQNNDKCFPKITLIPPKVYCLVLLFLSYHNTGKIELRNQTLEKLCESIQRREFMDDDDDDDSVIVVSLLDRCIEIASVVT